MKYRAVIFDLFGTLVENFTEKVVDEIISVCEEIEPSYVILGRPQEDRENNLLTLERLQAFAERIEEACQAQVIYASED